MFVSLSKDCIGKSRIYYNNFFLMPPMVTDIMVILFNSLKSKYGLLDKTKFGNPIDSSFCSLLSAFCTAIWSVTLPLFKFDFCNNFLFSVEHFLWLIPIQSTTTHKYFAHYNWPKKKAKTKKLVEFLEDFLVLYFLSFIYLCFITSLCQVKY